jgi:hypothetical protein
MQLPLLALSCMLAVACAQIRLPDAVSTPRLLRGMTVGTVADPVSQEILAIVLYYDSLHMGNWYGTSAELDRPNVPISWLCLDGQLVFNQYESMASESPVVDRARFDDPPETARVPYGRSDTQQIGCLLPNSIYAHDIGRFSSRGEEAYHRVSNVYRYACDDPTALVASVYLLDGATVTLKVLGRELRLTYPLNYTDNQPCTEPGEADGVIFSPADPTDKRTFDQYMKTSHHVPENTHSHTIINGMSVSFFTFSALLAVLQLLKPVLAMVDVPS